MITESRAMSEALVDEAIVCRMVPWPCPSQFGPGGRYRLEEVIGVGRMSLVYQAVDTRLSSEDFEATVAIKIVADEYLQRREALNARRVRHDHVVGILDRGTTQDGVSYIVQELVEGPTLAEKKVPWTPRRAAEFMIKVCRGMQAVHAAGVVHCDLKPANVLITDAGEPKISDFGLASAGGPEEATGGNLAFMSPERYREPIAGLAPPTDIYALAGLLYYLLTGRSPNGETPEEVADRLATPRPAPSPDVERDLDAICMRSLAPDPADRHDSAAALANDLESWLKQEPIAWTRPSAWRRCHLFLRRNYLMVGLIGLLLLAGASLLGGWAYLNFESHRNARRMAEQQIEDIKATAREHIEFFAQQIMPGNDPDIVANVLPTIIWLDWLTDHQLLEDIRATTVAEARVEMLTRVSQSLHERGESGYVESLLVDEALAYFLLLERDWTRAHALTTDAMTRWRDRMHQDDPLWLSLEAMHEAGLVLRDDALGAERDALRERLDRIDARLLEAGGCKPTRTLIRHLWHGVGR